MKLAALAKYRKSEKGRAARLRYNRTASGAANAREYQRRRLGLPTPTRPAPHNCECCGKLDLALDSALCLDHDHQTGAFRGWLCRPCNIGIGNLGDRIDGLENAIAYLQGKH